MTRRAKFIIFSVAIIQIFMILGLLALPRVVQAIPSRYLARLPEPLIEPFMAPLLELPTPAADIGQRPQERPQFEAALVEAAVATAVPSATPVAPATPTAMTADPAVTSTPEATATNTPAPTPTATPEPLPERVRLEGLQIIAQSFNNCGPANLTQVLNFYGSSVTQADVAVYLKPNPEDRNVSPWQLSDYVNQFTGFRSSAHSGGNLQLIKQLVAAGFPVVIEKGYEPNTSTSQGWMGHYLTVFGYDDQKQELYSLDTYLGPWDSSGRMDKYEAVQTYWQHFNYTFFVVYEQSEEARVQQILGAELVDRAAMWQRAVELAQAEISANADADNAFAWFNLGTSLTELGIMTGETAYYESGATAFDQARRIGLPPRMLWYQHRPLMAYYKLGRYDDVLSLVETTLATPGGQNVEELHWYKGHVLLARGQIAAAKAAYQRVLQLNENAYYAQFSLDYANSLRP
jgi:hypothetical protein